LQDNAEAKESMWYLDSGCSRHMTGDSSKFSKISYKVSGHVTYGDNNRGKILGSGKVRSSSTVEIEDVLLVDGLKHNLLSIIQLCDKNLKVTFEAHHCLICHASTNELVFVGKRIQNIYMVDFENTSFDSIACLFAKNDEPWIWHKRLAHIHMGHLNKLVSKKLVTGLPDIKLKSDKLCDACQKGKQVKTSFKSKQHISTSNPLELLHMDMFGPSRTKSLGGNFYALVLVDDYSRFTWTFFISSKSDTFSVFRKFAKIVENEKDLKIKSIRSDHGVSFKMNLLKSFMKIMVSHIISQPPRTPQQNGVIERKNRSLEELARTMLNDNSLPKYFWADVVSTACHVLNRVLIRPVLKLTPYEIYKGRKPNIPYFKAFGCKCFILNNGKSNLGKFDPKADEGIFLGYSSTSKAYRVYNKRTLTIEESIHVAFDENIDNHAANSSSSRNSAELNDTSADLMRILIIMLLIPLVQEIVQN